MPANLCCTNRLLPALLAVLVGAQAAAVARAQDEVIVDDAIVAPRPALKVVQPALVPNTEQVDQWVFGRMGGSAAARSRLESLLEVRIDDIERGCALSEAQKKKLKLAGLGDIKRFYDRVEDAKRKLVRAPGINIWQDAQPLQVQIQTGLFSDDSIFHKTIKNTLTEEQASRYEAMLSRRATERRRATIELFVAHLDKALGLGEDQRSRLVDVISTEVPAPLKMGQSDYWYLMYGASKLPESTLRPIFDEPQWRLLSRQFPQARGMEQWLRNNGIIAGGPAVGAQSTKAVAAPRAAGAAVRRGFTGQ